MRGKRVTSTHEVQRPTSLFEQARGARDSHAGRQQVAAGRRLQHRGALGVVRDAQPQGARVKGHRVRGGPRSDQDGFVDGVGACVAHPDGLPRRDVLGRPLQGGAGAHREVGRAPEPGGSGGGRGGCRWGWQHWGMV